MKALTLWQPWASLCVLPLNLRFEERHRVEGGSVSCGYCNHTFTFNFMRDQGPHECSCTRATIARADAARPAKTIETRGWAAPKSLIGQRIAIHAAATKRPLADLLKAEALGELVDPGDTDPFEIGPARTILDAVRSAGVEPIDLRLGAVVGTAVLTDCLPMVAHDSSYTEAGADAVPPLLEVEGTPAHRLTLWRPGGYWDTREAEEHDVSDQLPYGWFEPGRYGWMLTDVERFPRPVPATGRQGLWEWKP